jgi:hypothetical protein
MRIFFSSKNVDRNAIAHRISSGVIFVIVFYPVDVSYCSFAAQVTSVSIVAFQLGQLPLEFAYPPSQHLILPHKHGRFRLVESRLVPKR